MNTAPMLAAVGLLATVALGAVWTGQAIAAGEVTSTVIRFALSVAGGFYYLIMYRIASGRQALPR